MIRSDDLSYSYRTWNDDLQADELSPALEHIDLHISPGEFVAILGANGSGKSTLARQMNALLIPDSGTMTVGGYDTRPEENLLKVRQTAGMVFQNPDNQIVASIVEEDVAFGPENLGVPSEKIRSRVDASLETVSMSEYALKSPTSLSGGQKQRVAIAGVLATMPACILLDEPTAMLDPMGRREIIDTIVDINRKRHITIILITHNMEEALPADRIIVMNSRKIVCEGTPREIFSQVEMLHSLRLDVPVVTELAWSLKQSGVPLPDGILSEDELISALREVR